MDSWGGLQGWKLRFGTFFRSSRRTVGRDLLAALVATDCAPLLHLLELDLDPLSLSVRREVKASDTDRHDIVLWCTGRACVVVEVKVLSGLGRAQLARYEESAPGADLYVIVNPAGLVVDTSGSPRAASCHLGVGAQRAR